MTLQSNFEDILAAYPKPGTRDSAIHQGTKSQVVQLFVEAIETIKGSDAFATMAQALDLRVNKPSRWGYWPWIAILSAKESATTQVGTYLVYLFSAAGDRVYLALAQGASFGSNAAHSLSLAQLHAKTTGQAPPTGAVPRFRMSELEQRTSEYRSKLPLAKELLDEGWVQGDQMDLSLPAGVSTPTVTGMQATGRQYEASTIVAKEYLAGSVPEDAALFRDLDQALTVYQQFLTSGISHTNELLDSGKDGAGGTGGVMPPSAENLSIIVEAYAAQGLRFSQETIAAFVTALQTKGFVILSGLSGTGKTKIAQALGRFAYDADVGNEPLFLSVRPDWRDSKPLLGYTNPILQDNPYQSTRFIEFVKDAVADFKGSDDPSPWLVLLDEMNLARVEYYFADLLSVLESGRDHDGFTLAPLVADIDIFLPPNLFFVGTVNIDETTHAFSPKVLDRAFTLELSRVDFSGYPDGLVGSGDVSDEVRTSVTALLGRGGSWAQVLKSDVEECVSQHPFVRQHLSALSDALAPFLMNFGYRVFDEIAEFTLLAASNGLYGQDPGSAAKNAFDDAVLMKVLPKFYGSRQRLEEPLIVVRGWCVSPDDVEAGKDAPAELDAQYPATLARVERMKTELARDGFSSFG